MHYTGNCFVTPELGTLLLPDHNTGFPEPASNFPDGEIVSSHFKEVFPWATILANCVIAPRAGLLDIEAFEEAIDSSRNFTLHCVHGISKIGATDECVYTSVAVDVDRLYFMGELRVLRKPGLFTHELAINDGCVNYLIEFSFDSFDMVNGNINSALYRKDEEDSDYRFVRMDSFTMLIYQNRSRACRYLRANTLA